MSGNVFIETPRLHIKNIEITDFDRLRLLQKDPDVMAFFGGPRDDSQINNYSMLLYEHLQKYNFSVGLVFQKETGTFIGRAGLICLDFNGPEDIEFGGSLFKEYWGKGYAKELGEALVDYAFHVLNYNRVYATVDPKNIISETVIKGLGMTLEKTDVYKTNNKQVMYYVKYKDN